MASNRFTIGLLVAGLGAAVAWWILSRNDAEETPDRGGGGKGKVAESNVPKIPRVSEPEPQMPLVRLHDRTWPVLFGDGDLQADLMRSLIADLTETYSAFKVYRVLPNKPAKRILMAGKQVPIESSLDFSQNEFFGVAEVLSEHFGDVVIRDGKSFLCIPEIVTDAYQAKLALMSSYSGAQKALGVFIEQINALDKTLGKLADEEVRELLYFASRRPPGPTVAVMRTELRVFATHRLGTASLFDLNVVDIRGTKLLVTRARLIPRDTREGFRRKIDLGYHLRRWRLTF